MIHRIVRIGLIGVMCFVFFGCTFLVKQLHLSVPPRIVANTPEYWGIELDATVSTTFPVPDPFDGVSANLTVQLIATGSGSDKLYLNPSTVEIEKGYSVGTFKVSAIYDGIAGLDEEVTITATAPSYEEDSVTITISLTGL